MTPTEARGMERAANHCDECSGKLTVHQVAHELWAKADEWSSKLSSPSQRSRANE